MRRDQQQREAAGEEGSGPAGQRGRKAAGGRRGSAGAKRGEAKQARLAEVRGRAALLQCRLAGGGGAGGGAAPAPAPAPLLLAGRRGGRRCRASAPQWEAPSSQPPLRWARQCHAAPSAPRLRPQAGSAAASAALDAEIGWQEPMPEAPTYFPTLEQWADPLDYVRSIQARRLPSAAPRPAHSVLAEQGRHGRRAAGRQGESSAAGTAGEAADLVVVAAWRLGCSLFPRRARKS